MLCIIVDVNNLSAAAVRQCLAISHLDSFDLIQVRKADKQFPVFFQIPVIRLQHIDRKRLSAQAVLRLKQPSALLFITDAKPL